MIYWFGLWAGEIRRPNFRGRAVRLIANVHGCHICYHNFMPKLIIVRGPSGSGKSTVCNELLDRSSEPLLLVGEDKLRKMFSDHRSTPHPASEQLALQAIRIGLENGYHVVYQGILNAKSGEFRPNELLQLHPTETYFFYLDVGFEKTIERHQTRHKRDKFGADAMKRWWDYSSPLEHELETLIPESSSLDDTLATICKVTGLGLAPAVAQG